MPINNSRLCGKCQKEISAGFAYCPYCGTSATARKRTKRANGSGAIYRENGSWCASKTVSLDVTGGRLIQKRIKRRGFPTKKEASEWLAGVTYNRISNTPMPLGQAYLSWKDGYVGRVGESTMKCYVSAWGHLRALESKTVDTVTAQELQRCIDECGSGKRTKQLIKVLANLIFKWCQDNRMVILNPAANLYTGADPTGTRAPLTDQEIDLIDHSGYAYSEYIVAMCYLGFRPSEFFGLKKSDLHEEGGIKYLVQGSKTEAGKNRRVTIPPRIREIIRHQMQSNPSEYLFPRILDDKNGIRYQRMSEAYFREWIFKPMMAKLGIVGKLPYGTRHTYSNKLAVSAGADKDKAGLIGHSDYRTTQKYYQSAELERMEAITSQMD